MPRRACRVRAGTCSFALYVEEQRGKSLGLPPSYLSRCQDVTKNTISVLLRGLEDQGWIERTLDPDDRRVFRIRLTPAGRELIRTRPRRAWRTSTPWWTTWAPMIAGSSSGCSRNYTVR